MIWDEAKRETFRQLQVRAAEGALSDAEAHKLAQLAAELESTEAAVLAPALQRLRDERRLTAATNGALETMLRREEALAERLRTVLDEANAEQKAIRSEVERILAGRV